MHLTTKRSGMPAISAFGEREAGKYPTAVLGSRGLNAEVSCDRGRPVRTVNLPLPAKVVGRSQSTQSQLAQANYRDPAPLT